MVLRFIERLWNKRLLVTERERKLAADRLQQERVEKEERQRKEAEEARDDFTVAVLLSEELQRFAEQLSRDLAAATQAARLAYEQAAMAEEQAAADLSRVQDNALVLAGGERVYFTQDGAALYGEDRLRIEEQQKLDEARRLQDEHPAASTYEDFLQADDDFRQAQAQRIQLADTLEKLDELNAAVAGGKLSPDELVKAREELDRIVASLPASAQEAYRQLQAERAEPDAAGPSTQVSLSGAPLARTDFERAAKQLAQNLEHKEELDPEPDRTPVYKAAPPME